VAATRSPQRGLGFRERDKWASGGGPTRSVPTAPFLEGLGGLSKWVVLMGWPNWARERGHFILFLFLNNL
jgi:hypothetical protein